MSLRTEAIAQGLTSDEFDRIVKALGREPNSVELGIFSAMWSEHCCYKSTRIHLKELPTKGPRVVQGPGENAGVIEITPELVAAFKIESHNHPSFIEPYQGAATGVGGILRDIFTMGARPIAVLDSLYFGEPKNEKTPHLFYGVVGGVGGYGNCMGIPNVGGEVHFDASYNGNNLVNAMAVGIARKEHLYRAVAKGEGNVVLYLGSKTGADGIHGASMASQEFGSGNEERRPTVQVGDPFMEKLLLEACLEMIQEKTLVGIQDMGAAGIACSTFEMSGRGGSGMDIDLDKIPLRKAEMTAYEIFLSESQERMLLVAEPGQVARIQAIAKKWDVDCVAIGNVTGTGRVKARHHGETVVDLPVAPVTDEAPIYDRPSISPRVKTTVLGAGDLPRLSVERGVLSLLRGPTLGSRRPVFRQYDHTVGNDSVIQPGGDAAVMRVKGEMGGLAMTVDSNSAYCDSDPYWGTVHVVAEAARNIAVTGAQPLAVTNCLNFGNPEEPEVMGQIRSAIRGIRDACNFFETPVTGGNVSLYNQTGNQNIKPTPTIGMVGWIDDASHVVRAGFTRAHAQVALLGSGGDGKFYRSVFAQEILRREDLACPPISLAEEKKLQKCLLDLSGGGFLFSAHDCSDGGLVFALIESCLEAGVHGMGAKFVLPQGAEAFSFLFGEYASRAVISFAPEHERNVRQWAARHGVPLTMLGKTGGDLMEIKGVARWNVAELKDASEAFFRSL